MEPKASLIIQKTTLRWVYDLIENSKVPELILPTIGAKIISLSEQIHGE